MLEPKLPEAPSSIQKGVPLANVLNQSAIEQLAFNLSIPYNSFNQKDFVAACIEGLEPLGIKERASHIGEVMHQFLPEKFSDAVEVILGSLTKPLNRTDEMGLSPMFYMPHCSYVGAYGVEPEHNGGEDPFEAAMNIQYELTQRFTCEFSIRSFITKYQDRTMDVLLKWMHDPNPHVRRLTTEGTRPRLPWAAKLDAFVKDPTVAMPILEQLKDDPDLYVRRSVANHLGDIAKDHMDFALDTCDRWLKDASKERKWVIRHALRNPFKKGIERAIEIRTAAK